MKWYEHGTLLIGVAMFLTSMWAMKAAVFIFFAVPYGVQIFAGMGISFVAYKLFNMAYEMQDEYWYRAQFNNTGDDFEGRYCEAPCRHYEN